MITITHRIQLLPNNKQKTYFCKAIGCCRLAYNWGLNEWCRRYNNGERNLNGRTIRNAFNAIRKEQFPFTYDVTKYATAHAFDDLHTAFKNFFEKRSKYPKHHKKKNGDGSFYIGPDQVRLSEINPKLKHLTCNERGKRQYIKIPNLGYVKMSEHLRFNGKMLGVRISQNGKHFYASFYIVITEDEYIRTHQNTISDRYASVGIDFGVKNAMTLSDGIVIHSPYALRKHQRKIVRLSRQLSKRQYAKTKQERLSGIKKSANFKKLSVRLRDVHRHVSNIRKNFSHKITTILTTTYKDIAIESLNVESMRRNKKLAKYVSDAAMGEMCINIKQKAEKNKVSITYADRWYASSRICHSCGCKNDSLTLKDRTFVCPNCKTEIDRDFNASLNLLKLIKQNVGVDCPELTPADLTALQSRFVLNGIATSKVETGKQHKY